MEGLRGFAVFLVFLVHYVGLISPWLNQQSALALTCNAIHVIGNTGVDIFFVLSGYLIYGSLINRHQPFLPFFRRRIARIYPVFTVMFVFYVALSLAFPRENKIPPVPLDALLYLAQNYFLVAGLYSTQPLLITVSWSLSYEMTFYLLLPLLVGVLALRERGAQWRLVFWYGVILASAIIFALFGGPVRMLMFFAGIVLHEVMTTAPANKRAPPPALVLPVVLAAAAGMLLGFPMVLKFCLLGLAVFLVCLSCFRQPDAALGRFFSYSPLRWLGNMSYSYYLMHGLALKAAIAVLARLLPPAPHGALFFGAGLLLMFAWTLLPSAALFLLVERPMSLAPPRLAGKPVRA
jgi:peptidoglycan/LPS O-acetylase OafA/YrhL